MCNLNKKKPKDVNSGYEWMNEWMDTERLNAKDVPSYYSSVFVCVRILYVYVLYTEGSS